MSLAIGRKLVAIFYSLGSHGTETSLVPYEVDVSSMYRRRLMVLPGCSKMYIACFHRYSRRHNQHSTMGRTDMFEGDSTISNSKHSSSKHTSSNSKRISRKIKPVTLWTIRLTNLCLQTGAQFKCRLPAATAKSYRPFILRVWLSRRQLSMIIPHFCQNNMPETCF